MNNSILWILLILIIGGGIFFVMNQSSDSEDSSNVSMMSFFITSENPGKGANLGGLAGADAHCQNLAMLSGAEDRTWRAYLSTTATDDAEAVNARDRIGEGPWYNFDGVLIANSVEELHGENNPINKETGLDENGNQVNGRGDEPNLHDILTGSTAEGMASVEERDTTCSNWTSESEEGSTIVGHHDRLGPDTLETATSWNAAHGSRGCNLENLNGTGGGGLLYCFATD